MSINLPPTPPPPWKPPAAAADVANTSVGQSPAGTTSVESDALLGSRGELKITHNGEIYSLRRTRLGKLILTK